MTAKGILDAEAGWVGAVARLGVPVVLSVMLVWFLVVRVDVTQTLIITNQASIVTTQHAIISSMAEAKVVMSIFAVNQQQDTAVMSALLLQTCLNTARGAEQQSACVLATALKKK